MEERGLNSVMNVIVLLIQVKVCIVFLASESSNIIASISYKFMSFISVCPLEIHLRFFRTTNITF
jgi:hypothetical protein